MKISPARFLVLKYNFVQKKRDTLLVNHFKEGATRCAVKTNVIIYLYLLSHKLTIPRCWRYLLLYSDEKFGEFPALFLSLSWFASPFAIKISLYNVLVVVVFLHQFWSRWNCKLGGMCKIPDYTSHWILLTRFVYALYVYYRHYLEWLINLHIFKNERSFHSIIQKQNLPDS